MSEIEKMHFVPNEVIRIENILSKQMDFTAKSKFKKFKTKNQRKEVIVYPPKWNNDSISAQYIITIFQIIIISLWASGVFIEYQNIGIGFTIFVYFLYFFESFNCIAFKQLFNSRERSIFMKDLEKYKAGKPELCLDIKCYKSYDEYGSDTNYTYMEEVKFEYDSQVDKSPQFPNVFDTYSIVRVENILTFSYSDQLSEYYFESMRRNALHRCYSKSSHVKSFNNSNVPGLVSHVMIKQNKIINFFYSWVVYTLFTLVGLTIVYRIILNMRTPLVHNYIHKVIQVNFNHKKLLDNQLRQADFLNQNNKITKEEYQEFKQFYSQFYYQKESFLNIYNQTPILSSQGMNSKLTQPSEVLKFDNQNNLSQKQVEELL
ncbi:hypothetical protein ABPG72_014631 [Tetrahymena utriculariae]